MGGLNRDFQEMQALNEPRVQLLTNDSLCMECWWIWGEGGIAVNSVYHDVVFKIKENRTIQ